MRVSVPDAGGYKRVRRRASPTAERRQLAAWSLAQLVLHHFAGGVAGELVDEPEVAGAFVVGEALGAEREQRLVRERRAGLAHHERADVLAEHLVRHADDRGLLHVGVLEDHGLDVGGVDVVAAADDHVLDAARDVDEAVGVEVREVAGAQPAVGGPRRRGRAVVLVVLAPLARQAHEQLADLESARGPRRCRDRRRAPPSAGSACRPNRCACRPPPSAS